SLFCCETAVTCVLPLVSVPVLSKKICLSWLRCCNPFASFTKMPNLAACPVPTIIDIGIANPNAQGQEITKTEIAAKVAALISAPLNNHKQKVKVAISKTVGTKMAAILSTSVANCGLEV